MQQSEALCKVLQGLQVVAKHPRLELLKHMLQVLSLGLQFHRSLSQYEALGQDAAARIRADAQQSLLKTIVKSKFLLLSNASWVDAYIEKNMPAEGVLDDINDTPSVNMLFNLKGMAVTNWKVESDTVVDAVELVCAQFQERLNTAMLNLKRLAGSLAEPGSSWHNEIPDTASPEDVLKTGHGSRLITGFPGP